MKKLVNLIALVMLVSTNVLTPFSYAQVEIPEVIPENEVGNVEEIGETLEKDNEITGEIPNSLGEVEGEGILPLVREVVNETSPAKQGENLEGLKEEVEDSIDAVESPTTGEDKKEDAEKVEIDEVVQQVEENKEGEKQDENLQGDEPEEELGLQKIDEPTIMEEEPGTSVTLLPGQEFNAMIKTLTNNGNIQSFERVDEIPVGVATGEISIAGAEYPVYAGFSGGVLYYSTKAKIIYVNEETHDLDMFRGIGGLVSLDLSGWDFTKWTSMHLIFYLGVDSDLEYLDLTNAKFSGSMYRAFADLSKLREIKLDGVDTSDVTDMSQMFNNCSSLTGLDLSSFDTSKVNDMERMFNGCSKLERLFIGSWDTSKVIDMSFMFQGCSSLSNLKFLNSLNISNVTDLKLMFAQCSSITGLDLSNWDTSNVEYMINMFAGCSQLENLNLDNWVINDSLNFGGMFGGANNLKTVSMRNWTIPEIFQNAIGCRTSSLCATDLESIDVSNWDLSNAKDLQHLFGNSTAREIKGLNTWDTSGVTNMNSMFQNCFNLTGLDLSSWDTSNVTSMYTMFNNCSSLTGLDLSNWDTSNVTYMSSMFAGSTNLEYLNLSGWDFTHLFNGFGMGTLAGGQTLIKYLNLSNAKFTGNISYGFNYVKIGEVNLDGADVSNVTNMTSLFAGNDTLTKIGLEGWDTSNVGYMGYMFYNCEGLNELDLSSWDTSNVKNMNSMFDNTPNLKTIYASDKFVVDVPEEARYGSMNMFTNDVALVGGNGTKFDSNYIDKEYAKIDKVGQTGYFTDKNAINVKFINTLDGTETTSTFAKGQKLTPPYVDKYHVVGGYLDEAMKQTIDLNKGVDSYSVIYIKYERNGSSGGGGGGGSSKKTDEDTHGSAEDSQKNSEENAGKEIPPVSPLTEGGLEQPEGQGNGRSNTSDNSYTNEQKEAYEFAKENGITTMPTIQKADMSGKLTRIQMAKMLSQYAINVLGQTPDTSKTIKFRDVTSKKDADYDNGVTLAYQLGIMGQNMPNNKFRPNDEVSRAEFATALSRLLYQTTDGEYKSTSKYYTPHMAKLYNEGIINNTDPGMKERRGYVMIMLMRSSK